MLADGDYFWQLVDPTLQVLGWLVVLSVVILTARRYHWRQPLPRQGVPPATLTPVALLLLLTGPMLLTLVGQTIVATALGISTAWQPPAGSAPWHTWQAASQAVALLVGLVTLVLVRQMRTSLDWRPLREVALWRDTKLIVAAVLAFCALGGAQLNMTTVLWEWAGREPATHPVLQAAARGDLKWLDQLPLLIGAVVVAPIVEEIYYRGLVLELFRRATRRAWPAIIASGVLFGLVHMDVPTSVLPLMTFGVLLGYLRVKTRGLGVSILTHAVFNARSMVLVLAAPELLTQ